MIKILFMENEMLTSSEAIKIIKANKNVAVVGLSPKTERPSHIVGGFLLSKGFNVIPINPGPHKTILEQKSYQNLSELEPNDIDWIDLFVNPTRLMSMVDEIKRLKPKLVWCQIGVISEEFNQAMEKAGISLIIDLCPKIEWN
jgi:uncharacterized protein